VPSRGSSSNSRLSTLDIAKIVLAIVAVIVLVRVVFWIIGATIAVISTLLVGAAIVAAAWVLWSLLSSRGD
jgi:hypothetical protein